MRTTANWIAAVRARESSRPDRLFDDPYAEALAGPQGYAMMARSEQAAGGENRMVPVRVRWFDDAIIAAVASGIRTVVMLGAGLDTRPYRLPVFKDLHWYELDRRDVLEAKAAALAGIPPRATVTQLEADLTRELPLPVFEEPVVWVAEGLFFYFTESSIVDLLANAARQCPQGSVFLGDVTGTAGLDSPAMRVPAMVRTHREPAAVRVRRPFGAVRQGRVAVGRGERARRAGRQLRPPAHGAARPASGCAPLRPRQAARRW